MQELQHNGHHDGSSTLGYHMLSDHELQDMASHNHSPSSSSSNLGYHMLSDHELQEMASLDHFANSLLGGNSVVTGTNAFHGPAPLAGGLPMMDPTAAALQSMKL